MSFARGATGLLNTSQAVKSPCPAKRSLQAKAVMKKSPGASYSSDGHGSFFMCSCFIYCLKMHDGHLKVDFFPSGDYFMHPGLGGRLILA